MAPAVVCSMRARCLAVRRPRLIEVVHLEHQPNRSNAADCVRREHTEPKRYGAYEFAVDVNRASAHAAGDVRTRSLTGQLRDDDVLARSPHVG